MRFAHLANIEAGSRVVDFDGECRLRVMSVVFGQFAECLLTL